MSAAGYVPGEGDRVMVRRWEQPTLADADPERVLSFQFAGTVIEVDRSQGRALYYFDWDDLAVIYDNVGYDAADLRAICPDAVFLPAGENGSQAYLVTEMTPVDPSAREPYRVQLSPDMAVTLDGSQCVVLDITDPRAGVTEHRVTVSSVDALKTALDGALAAQRVVTDAGDRRRYAGLGEARRARGQLTRPEAVDWLIGKGYGRGLAVNVTGRLRGEGGSVLGMTYDSQYWRVPAGDALVKEG